MSKHDVDLGLGVAGWVAFGIGAAGTVTYALVDWLPSKKPAQDGAPPAPAVQGIQVTPLVGPGFAGVMGQF